MGRKLRKLKKVSAFRFDVDSEGLTEKQRLFVENLLADPDMNAEAAKRNSGYSDATHVDNILRSEVVRKAIRKRQDDLMKKVLKPLRIDQERVLDEFAKLAFESDILDMFKGGPNGNLVLKDLSDLNEYQKASVQKIKFKTDKDGNQYISEISLFSKLQALDALARHLGLFEKDNLQRKDNSFGLDDVLSVLPIEDDRKDIIKKEFEKRVNIRKEILH